MNTYPHCTALTAKVDFTFKVGGKGRSIQIRAGQSFWITNTRIDQQTRGIVLVDRKGKGCISHGYAFTPEQIATLFQA